MASQFDYIGSRATANQLIQFFGMKASLVREGVFRDCWVAITEYQTKDADTLLANPTDRVVFMSASLGDVLTTPPDFNRDQLVTYVQPATIPPVQDEVLPFTMPIKPIKPAGIVVVYQTAVRR